MRILPPFLSGQGPVHFMGVAGAGMVALAELLARSGVEVTGCDLAPDPAARALSSLGVPVLAGHHPSHVEDASVLVITAAVPAHHPEVLRARERGIPVLKRAQLLGEWVNQGRVVAVAGTHGKTTTTAMITEILVGAGLDPTGLVGGRVPAWGSNLRLGGSDLFVVEADEYDRSFHHLRPLVAVVTNIEADHLDVYGSLDGVAEGFRTFLEGVSPAGRVAVCADDPLALQVGREVRPDALTFGLELGAAIRGVQLRQEGRRIRLAVEEHQEPRGEILLRVPGRHNVRNALGAAAAARALGVDWKFIRKGLEAFQGVGRRFQVLGEVEGVVVVDDYAHHPTEIQATLEAARSRFPGRRIVAVFQPHLFSRTRDFVEEFGKALATADEVWVTEVYPAREEPIPGVSGVLVAQAVLQAGASQVSYEASLKALPKALVQRLQPGDVCLLLGAGSIEFVGPDVLAALRQRAAGKGGEA